LGKKGLDRKNIGQRSRGSGRVIECIL